MGGTLTVEVVVLLSGQYVRLLASCGGWVCRVGTLVVGSGSCEHTVGS